MKKCQTCNNQNADDMRFCLNCGSTLPDAPVIVNFGAGAQGGQSNPGTNPYGKSMETQFGGKPGFQQPQQNFSMVPPASKGGGSKKIFIAVGGVVVLLFLIVAAVGSIFVYNVMKDKKEIVSTSPTPTVSPSTSPSASPSPSASKSASPSPKPTTALKSSVDGKAKFDKIWVDYNVTEDGEKGMRIHLKFEVTGMEGVDSYVMVYFQKEDGTNLTTGSSVYGSKDGRVVAKRALKPGYDVTVYKDLDVFMPYTELNLTSGKYDLKMDADLTDDDEGLIQHLGYHEFQYEKP
ncbi:MAG TPA: zinc ribbon domain-containing protein [Pyrinomonadaceae bacterium]|jgi:hypothetical protein|nr:zinc ribbon domain-containing protein [Pyrinomonadaceae bacterium]